jgi:hypothetical protein
MANHVIGVFAGGKEYLMRAHFNLPSVLSEDVEARAPMKVKFEIPYFTTSGIQVSFFPTRPAFSHRLFISHCTCHKMRVQ